MTDELWGYHWQSCDLFERNRIFYARDTCSLFRVAAKRFDSVTWCISKKNFIVQGQLPWLFAWFWTAVARKGKPTKSLGNAPRAMSTNFQCCMLPFPNLQIIKGLNSNQEINYRWKPLSCNERNGPWKIRMCPRKLDQELWQLHRDLSFCFPNWSQRRPEEWYIDGFHESTHRACQAIAAPILF